MINSKDISVVVQGALDNKLIHKCLKSLKKYLPNAQIILSTWENSNVSGLEQYCDKILLNKDPGAYTFDTFGTKNNSNRQLVSTKAGLELCNRKYILKLRSDLVLKNDNILKIEDNFKRSEKFKTFKNRILANNIYSFKFLQQEDKKQFYPFQISDWWFFGLSEDIKTLFDIPLQKEPEFSHYFIRNKKPKDKFIYYKHINWKMTTEQYIHYECAKKHFPEIQFENLADYNPVNIEQSNYYIVNNYLIIDSKHSGIFINKKDYRGINLIKYNGYSFESIYYFENWLSDYKKYINPEYKFDFLTEVKMNILHTSEFNKLLRHILQLFECLDNIFKPFFKIINEIISIIYYSYKLLLKILFKRKK